MNLYICPSSKTRHIAAPRATCGHRRRVSASVASRSTSGKLPELQQMPHGTILLFDQERLIADLKREDTSKMRPYIIHAESLGFRYIGTVDNTLIMAQGVALNPNPAQQETRPSLCQKGGSNAELTPVPSEVTPIQDCSFSAVHFRPATSVVENRVTLSWDEYESKSGSLLLSDAIIPAGTVKIWFEAKRSGRFICVALTHIAAHLDEPSVFVESVDLQIAFEHKVDGEWVEIASKCSLVYPQLGSKQVFEECFVSIKPDWRSNFPLAGGWSLAGLTLQVTGNPANGNIQGPSDKCITLACLRQVRTPLVRELTQRSFRLARDPECISVLRSEDLHNFSMSSDGEVAFWIEEPDAQVAVHLVVGLSLVPFRRQGDDIVVARSALVEAKPFGHQRFVLGKDMTEVDVILESDDRY